MSSQALAGYEVKRTATPRDPMFSHEGERLLPAGILIDSALAIDGGNTGRTYEIRAGWLMGRITASGLYVPCKRSAVTPTGGATSQDIPVVNAAAFKAGDTISVGADTGKTIDTVNYSTNTITVTDVAFTFANDEAVVAEDGSQTARGVLKDTVELLDADRTGAANKSSGLYVGGLVKVSMLLGDEAAIRADTTSAALLDDFIYSDDYGQ